jgi:hypothetical protein
MQPITSELFKPLTLAVLIDVEAVLGTDRLNILIQGGNITLSYAEREVLLSTILISHDGLHETPMEEVEQLLNFFIILLAMHSDAGRKSVLASLFTSLTSEQEKAPPQDKSTTSRRKAAPTPTPPGKSRKVKPTTKPSKRSRSRRS